MKADGTILVGVSGSAASRVALRWAADEAERRECGLRIVLIWQREKRASYAQQNRRDSTECREDAWCVLTDSIRTMLGSGPLRNATVEVVEGRAEQELVVASEDADLLVLGSGPAAVVGPVIRTCLAEARCPVVVVGRHARPTRVSRPAAPPASRPAAVGASR
jgi:nucleotide-binding universal stress UspA family protein